MTTNNRSVSIADAFATANKMAADREAQSGELLWGELAKRASTDEGFRKQLAKEPEDTVKSVAQDLKVPVSKEELDTAKQLFGSPVLPGINHERVEKLVFGTIDDVRRSFNMTLSLSRWLFIVGLLMLVASVVFTWLKGAKAGSIYGIGGVASLVSALLLNPLDRIRNAGANLVQIQMAYLAYYNLLYLLGSRNEHLDLADSQAYADELRKTAMSMVATVQQVVQEGARAPAARDRKLNTKGSDHELDAAGSGRVANAKGRKAATGPKASSDA